MHIWQIVGGFSLFGILAHAAQTIPPVKDPWASWVIGCIQYALSNYDKGSAAMQVK